MRVSAMKDPTGGCCRKAVDPLQRGRTVKENFMEASALSNFASGGRCYGGGRFLKAVDIDGAAAKRPLPKGR